jgi:hypothetical protein
MPSIAYDWNYLKAGLSAIEEFLLSAELFWPIGISAPRSENAYPQLSLGGLLLARQRLLARDPSHLPADLQPELQKMDAARLGWPVAWERKANGEFVIRLNLWRDYLEDYRQNPDRHAHRYAYEVSRRVQLQLLLPETRNLDHAYLDLLSSLDHYQGSVFIPGGFTWEEDLLPAFPPATYPYLYGSLRD